MVEIKDTFLKNSCLFRLVSIAVYPYRGEPHQVPCLRTLRKNINRRNRSHGFFIMRNIRYYCATILTQNEETGSALLSIAEHCPILFIIRTPFVRKSLACMDFFEKAFSKSWCELQQPKVSLQKTFKWKCPPERTLAFHFPISHETTAEATDVKAATAAEAGGTANAVFCSNNLHFYLTLFTHKWLG